MKKGNNKLKGPRNRIDNQKDQNFPEYPVYSTTEDVFSKWKEESEINPEDITKQKTPNDKPGNSNDEGFEDNVTGSDLDVPGSELDDQQEELVSEDEENNYYSLGGDAHNNLEEDKE